MVAHPVFGARWIGSALTRKPPIVQRLPWTSWGSIEYLRAHVKPGARVLEWGGGGSTCFFVDRGCRVTTIESNEYWKDQIAKDATQGRADGAGTLDLQFIPAETKDPAAVQRYIAALHQGDPWDVVLVDGLEEDYLNRIDCMREVAAHPQRVRPGGMVILDDAWRDQYRIVPTEIFSGWRRMSFRTLGPARLGVTQTDVYLRPSA
jgi:hypothetical protein